MQIIYFGNDWSAENRTSSHHIASQLCHLHEILYVECPGLRAPKGNKRDIIKTFKKLASLFKRPVKFSDKLTVYTLVQIPLHGNKYIAKLNSMLSAYLLKRICKNIGFKSPVLWFVVPHAGHLIGELEESQTIYYCIDDYSALPDVDIDAVKKMDQELTLRADIVFTASRSLTDKKQTINKNVHYSPHGVDFEHFNRVYTESLKLPTEMANIAKPIIGFFGLIEAWIDLTLIQAISKRYPTMSIVLIGRAAVDTSKLEKLDNVYLLGKKSFSELPNYAKKFDVCILPYVDNDQIYNCNPIKLKEYLATGKPVVSVFFPEIAEFSEVVFIAESNEKFVECIEQALNSDSKEKIEQRINRVKQLTWENRVKEILHLMQKEQ